MTQNNLKPSQAELYQLVRQRSRQHLIDFSIATNPRYKPNWHNEIIAKELENIEVADYKILILMLPPRHGKSEEATINFPAWYLGNHPDKEIITASYSSELALDFGGKTRGLVDSEAYQHIFSLKLKEDEKSKAKWKTDNGGSYTSVGIGGAITGRGANCLDGETLIQTKTLKKIKDIKVGDMVLSMGEGLCYNKVVALKKSITTQLYEITTGNHIIRATGQHRFFIQGKGYTKAEDLQVGDKTISLKQSLSEVREKQERPGIILPGLLSGNEEVGCVSQMRLLRQGIFKKILRNQEGEKTRTQRFILFIGLFAKTPFFQKQFSLFNLRKINWKKGQEILFKKLLAISQGIRRYYLQVLRSFIQAYKPFNQILFVGLQKQFSFQSYDGQTESELETRIRNEQVSKGIPTEEISSQTGYKQGMYNLQKERKFDFTSSGLPSEKQSGKQFGFGLQTLSYNSSQVEENAISAITAIDIEQEVYDIQIENTHNFFANGVLTHNCLIIDDPIKNREEAESKLIRDKHWSWFTSTAYTRLEPNGKVILILTRWHLDDLAGRIFANEELKGKTKIIKFPAIATEDEQYRKVGEPLWKDRFGIEELTSIKNAIGIYDWSALYQQNPVLTENQEFRQEWFKYIERADIDKQNTRRFLTIDTAMSQKEESDYTGFCENYVNRENRWHFSAYKMKLNAKDFVDYLFTIQEKRNFEKIGIEKTAYSIGLKPFIDEEQRKRCKFLPIVELDHKQVNKEIRIRGLVPRYNVGMIYHIIGECKDLEEDLLTFPRSIHDDVMDSAAYQNQLAKEYIPPIKSFSSKQKLNPAR